jgi:hypothetical protein
MISKRREKSIFHLPIEQEIFVPSTTLGQKILKPNVFQRRINVVEKYLGKSFGGFTAVKGLGGYYSGDEKRVIREPVAIVTSFAQTKSFPQKQKRLMQQIRRWRRAWHQESMGYEFEGDLYYLGKQEYKKKQLKETIRKIVG